MIYATVRMYATVAEATHAYALLEARGLNRADDKINLVTPATAATADGIIAVLKAAFIPAAQARVYAQGIQRGLSLVSLVAPFGAGRMYQELLDDLHPVDSGVTEARETLTWSDAAPFSSAFGWPVISPPSPYLFMGLKAVADGGKTTSKSLGLPELADSRLSVFGRPQLSHNPAPFSGLFHLPLIR